MRIYLSYMLILALAMTIAIETASFYARPDPGGYGRSPLRDSTAARISAMKWIGLEEPGKKRGELTYATSELPEDFVDSITPFISGGRVSKRAWCVRIPRAIVPAPTLQNRTGDTAMLERTFTLILDSTNGRILFAQVSATGFASPYGIPTPGQSEELVRTVMYRFIGQPNVPPAQDLLSAIESCSAIGLMSGEILASYVECVYRNRDTFPAWYLFMRSAPAAPLGGPAALANRTHWFSIINAQTGRNEILGTAPLFYDSTATK